MDCDKHKFDAKAHVLKEKYTVKQLLQMDEK
jgi:hypothetical protein